ncbi:MAG: helix-turn-helix domain-containing protein [Clostridia bacterium]|nr:helix-turn-helix domain-containing protein [Clostridia bacterium]
MTVFYEARDENLFIGPMTRYPYPLHIHELVELACVLRGEVTMQIDGRVYTLLPGDIAVVFPLIPHSFDRLSPDTVGLAAFFLADTIPQLTPALLNALPESPVLRSEAVNAEARLAVDRLARIPEGEASPSRMAYLHLLVANALSEMHLRPIATYGEQGLAYRIFKYISDHACEAITLDNTARGLGISASHLSHLFSQRFHINFRRFVNAIRIDRAKLLMRDPRMTLTSICYSCGYGNIRTFRRAFLRETGMLPSEYCQKQRGTEDPCRAALPE